MSFCMLVERLCCHCQPIEEAATIESARGFSGSLEELYFMILDGREQPMNS